VIVLEIISWMKNGEFSDPEQFENLLGHVNELTRKGLVNFE